MPSPESLSIWGAQSPSGEIQALMALQDQLLDGDNMKETLGEKLWKGKEGIRT